VPLLVVDVRQFVHICTTTQYHHAVPTQCRVSARGASARRQRRTREAPAPASLAPGKQTIFSPKNAAVWSMFMSSAARTCLPTTVALEDEHGPGTRCACRQGCAQERIAAAKRAAPRRSSLTGGALLGPGPPSCSLLPPPRTSLAFKIIGGS
jgi:hypothetical protein